MHKQEPDPVPNGAAVTSLCALMGHLFGRQVSLAILADMYEETRGLGTKRTFTGFYTYAEGY